MEREKHCTVFPRTEYLTAECFRNAFYHIYWPLNNNRINSISVQLKRKLNIIFSTLWKIVNLLKNIKFSERGQILHSTSYRTRFGNREPIAFCDPCLPVIVKGKEARFGPFWDLESSTCALQQLPLLAKGANTRCYTKMKSSSFSHVLPQCVSLSWTYQRHEHNPGIFGLFYCDFWLIHFGT